MQHDCINRIICPGLNLRIYTVNSLNLVKKITNIHKTTPNATYSLGRAINATVLLSATLKPNSNQNISYRIQGNGPLKEVHVQADAKGNVRAYVANPQLDLNSAIERLSFSESIGAGLITITKDLNMKKPYSTVSPILNGEIALDTAYYLMNSEQIPSAIILGLNVDIESDIISSGGILIQTFPNTPESSIDLVEDNISNMDRTLGDALADGEDIIAITNEILGNNELQLLSTTNIQHNCRCNKIVLENVLKNSDKKDLIQMIEEDHGADITCTFCNKNYHFSEDELNIIVKNNY
jgi:molecular chaperone Hsp33